MPNPMTHVDYLITNFIPACVIGILLWTPSMVNQRANTLAMWGASSLEVFVGEFMHSLKILWSIYLTFLAP